MTVSAQWRTSGGMLSTCDCADAVPTHATTKTAATHPLQRVDFMKGLPPLMETITTAKYAGRGCAQRGVPRTLPRNPTRRTLETASHAGGISRAAPVVVA